MNAQQYNARQTRFQVQRTVKQLMEFVDHDAQINVLAFPGTLSELEQEITAYYSGWVGRDAIISYCRHCKTNYDVLRAEIDHYDVPSSYQNKAHSKLRVRVNNAVIRQLRSQYQLFESRWV